MEKIKSLFAEIENIKQKAVFIQAATGQGSMSSQNMFGMNAVGSQEDEMKKSLISDIRNYFTKSYRGIGGVGSISNQSTQMLAQKDQEDIRRIYNKIDDILTRECFYCGTTLIDMIDNDIFQDSSKAGGIPSEYEFFNHEEAQQIANIGEEEWKIK